MMNPKIKNGLLLAFGEIFLKSKGVQENFKQKLGNNIKQALKKEPDFNLITFRERFFLETGKENLRKAEKIIKNVFGINWVSRAYYLENTELKKVEKFVKESYADWVKKDQSFALRVKKSDQETKSTQEIINQIAKHIDRRVDLNNPDKTIFLEQRNGSWFVYFKKQKTAGGLPVGSQGSVLSLVSGGIDSSPAAYLTAKRGAENIWLHFHSFPFVSKASIQKTKELGKKFLAYQPGLTVYFVPFAEIQKNIKANAPAKYRVLLYRRIMLKLAEEIAKKNNHLALSTGESLGQVSSQTLANMRITQEEIKLPILRPLIGMDKEEIIHLAQKIKTYEISIQPQEDCCTLFVPKGQTAKGDLEIVKAIEKKLPLKKLFSRTLSELETVRIKN